MFFDPKNPRAIVNLVPEALSKRIKDVFYSDDGFLFGFPEAKLRLELTRRGRAPTATDSRIRLQFWLEYDRVQNDRIRAQPMEMGYVIGFAMGKEAFYTHYLQDPCAIVWMLCPPVSYMAALDECLREAMERVRANLQVEPVHPNGEPNLKMMEYQAKVEREWYQRKAAVDRRTPVPPPEEKESEAPKVDPAVESAEKMQRKLKLELMKKQNRISMPIPSADDV